MEVPVDQSGPPNAQSSPCTPQKSYWKIQDDDEEETDDEAVEFDGEDVVSPSVKPRQWTLLGEWDTTAGADLESEIKNDILHRASQHVVFWTS